MFFTNREMYYEMFSFREATSTYFQANKLRG